MKLIVFLSVFLVSSLQSQASEMVGALSAGQGGTGRAAVEPGESVFLNPAGLALLDQFYTTLGYQTGFLYENISRNTYGITMADGTAGIMFPGSLAYRRHSINNRGIRFSENEFRGGLGYRMMDRLSFGLSGSYLDGESELTGQQYSQGNFDLGLLIGLQPNWGLAVTGENLVEQDENLPLALRRPSRVTMGTQYIYERSTTFRYELLMPLYMDNTTLLAHRFGLSFQLRGNLSLQGGYSVDDSLGQNWSSVGLAWLGPRLKIAYSAQQENRLGLGNRHLVDLWVDI